MASASATTSSDALARRFADLRDGAPPGARGATSPPATRTSRESLELLRGLDDAGADVIEVGVPFSDPMADGPVIQASSQRALEQGMTLRPDARARGARARSRAGRAVQLPEPASGQPGRTRLERAADAGAHGVLVTDLPVGADPEREAWLGDGPLAFIRLVAPTTPPQRMAEIARHGSGFVYLISRLGVTGERADVATDLPDTVTALRQATSLPICVGFGISRPEQAATIGRLADGVVVGSAIVRAADRDVDAALSLAARDAHFCSTNCREPRSQPLRLVAPDPAGWLSRFVALIYDARWATHLGGIGLAVIVLVALRYHQISLTKYSSLHLLGVVAIGGALLMGAPATAARSDHRRVLHRLAVAREAGDGGLDQLRTRGARPHRRLWLLRLR